MSEPKISIVLSNYNGGDLLKSAIQSVIDQTFQDWELVLIDDCSTDHSREIISAFCDKRIRVTYFEKNQHMCYGFNYGISVSKGQYIARIDSDDVWLPEKLEKQYVFMEEHADYGACFTWVDVVDEFNNVLTARQSERVTIFKTNNMEQHEWIRYFYFIGPCLCHPTVLIRKSVLEDVGVYNYSLIQIQDYELWVRIVKKYPIHVITEILIHYRWLSTGKNASASSDTANIRSYYEYAYTMSRYFDDMPDEVFIKAFGNDFVIKGVKDASHLACEKALLLLKPAYGGGVQRIGGMSKLTDLLECDETREILRRDYEITQKFFYELSALPILHNPYVSVPNDLKAVSRKQLLKELVQRTFKKNKIIYLILSKCYKFIVYMKHKFE